MNRKKVVHITTMHQPFDTRIFRNECKSLSESGFDIILIANNNEKLIKDGVMIIPFKFEKGVIGRIFKNPINAVKIAKEIDADLYHFHDPELIFQMFFLALRGKKIIWDAHENYQNTIYRFNSLGNKILSFFGAYLFGFLELLFCKFFFSGVITITDKMGERYKRFSIETAIAGNFSDINQIPRKKYKVPNNSKIIFLSSGMQFKERCIFEMAEAIKILNKIDNSILRYAGTFKEDKYKNLIINLAKPVNNIEFIGPLSWTDLVLNEIPKGDIGLVLFDTRDPNNRHGLPNRFFECWSNGLPVITTAGTQVASIVKKFNGGLIIENNEAKSIAKAMNYFIDFPEQIEIMGNNARDAVEKYFCWDVSKKNIINLYNKILN